MLDTTEQIVLVQPAGRLLIASSGEARAVAAAAKDESETAKAQVLETFPAEALVNLRLLSSGKDRTDLGSIKWQDRRTVSVSELEKNAPDILAALVSRNLVNVSVYRRFDTPRRGK